MDKPKFVGLSDKRRVAAAFGALLLLIAAVIIIFANTKRQPDPVVWACNENTDVAQTTITIDDDQVKVTQAVNASVVLNFVDSTDSVAISAPDVYLVDKDVSGTLQGTTFTFPKSVLPGKIKNGQVSSRNVYATCELALQ